MRNFSGNRVAQSRAFTLVELLVVIAIIGILVALMLPAVQAVREAARRAQCQANLHNVALAVLNYESARKKFPEGMTFDPGGNTGQAKINVLDNYGPNWIVQILPYMEEQSLRDSFDKGVFVTPGTTGYRPINDNPSIPANVVARGAQISVLLCPSDGFNKILYQGTKLNHGPNWGRTNYAANAGRGFIYPGVGTFYMSGPAPNANANTAWVDDCQRGVMGPNESVTIKRITDGTTRSIMLAEIRVGPSPTDARGVWAMGHAGASLVAMYGAGGDDNGPNVCDPNGDDIISDICGAVGELTGDEMSGGCAACYQGTVFDQATTRSLHQGGVFVAMCDGSVQFVSDDIETSGKNGSCCTPWDRMIASGDQGKDGLYNGASARGSYCQ